jgi:hypothetical protein
MEITRMSPATKLYIDTVDGQAQDGGRGVEAVAFGVFASGAMRAMSGLPVDQMAAAVGLWRSMPLEDRARWLQRGRDTITYALSYVP